MEATIRIVGYPDHQRTSARMESLWLLVGGGWKGHGALAFYLGLDSRELGAEEALVQSIGNVVEEAATFGHCLDPNEIVELLREYRHARGILRPRRPEPETAA